MYLATIDTGTTNTRVTIWKYEVPISEASCSVGVRNTVVTGNNQVLKQAIKEMLEVAVRKANLTVDSLNLVLASGMLTSNAGLIEIPHLQVPVGRRDMAECMVEKYLPEVCKRPIWFVPGVKNVSCDYEMDMMRGEEVEVIGLMAKMKLKGAALFLLPGSHSKFVSVNQEEQIVGCLTTMAGELLDVLSKQTILAEAVQHDFSTVFYPSAFNAGVQCYRSLGLGRAAFTVRILEQFSQYSLEERRNYLLGVVLADDFRAYQQSYLAKKNVENRIIIAGRPIFQKGMRQLFTEQYPDKEIIEVDSVTQSDIAGLGALYVAKERGLID